MILMQNDCQMICVIPLTVKLIAWDYQYFKIQTSYFVANLLINIFGMWYSSEPVQVKPMISGNRVVFEDMKVGLGFSFPQGKTGKTEFCQKGQRSPLNPEFQENLSS